MRFNRYLIFYIILGLGLVASWTLVGKRAQIAPNLGMHVMSLDDDCRAWAAPCGAYAKDFALVLGPDPKGRGLRLVGEKLPEGLRLVVQQFDDSAHPLSEPLVKRQPGDGWRIAPDPEAVRLRVNLAAGEDQWVAEFPLRARRSF